MTSRPESAAAMDTDPSPGPTNDRANFGQYRAEAHGMSVAGTTFGGQVLSWIADGRERLFRGPADRHAEGTAVRGGIPVIFPQFAMRGSGGRHGFARRVSWRRVAEDVPGRLTFMLEDDASTRQAWPHPFRLQLEALLSPRALSVALNVCNTGTAPFDFAAALHTYLRTDDVTRARLSGLEGHHFHDSTRGEDALDPGPTLTLDSREIDRIYADVEAPLHYEDGQQRLAITMTGFRDVVLWNPGPEKAAGLPDLATGDHRRFICIEAARILSPVELPPGESWRGEQVFSLRADG